MYDQKRTNQDDAESSKTNPSNCGATTAAEIASLMDAGVHVTLPDEIVFEPADEFAGMLLNKCESWEDAIAVIDTMLAMDVGDGGSSVEDAIDILKEARARIDGVRHTPFETTPALVDRLQSCLK